jgi:hypothetical protein
MTNPLDTMRPYLKIQLELLLHILLKVKQINDHHQTSASSDLLGTDPLAHTVRKQQSALESSSLQFSDASQ